MTLPIDTLDEEVCTTVAEHFGILFRRARELGSRAPFGTVSLDDHGDAGEQLANDPAAMRAIGWLEGFSDALCISLKDLAAVAAATMPLREGIDDAAMPHLGAEDAS